VMLMELQSYLKNDFTNLSKTALFEYDSLAKLGEFIGREYADTVAEKFGVVAVTATPAAPVHPHSGELSEAIISTRALVLEEAKSTVLAGLPQGLKRFSGFASEQPQRSLAPAKSHKVAIIGMAGRFPKSTTLDDFWSNLKQAINTVEVIPSVRWNADDYYAPQVGRVIDKAASKWGGFIDALDDFDSGFFRMSKDEACKLDPQVKLALEMAWGSLEDAGYTPQTLSSHNVGVFMGTMSDDFTRVALDAAQAQQQYLGAGHVASEVANRLSFFLNLHGPSLAVQTACSSSAVALHLARSAILSGECDYALAGGVNVSLHPAKYLMLQDMRVLSPDGREATFDEHANGLVPSEGAGMVLLKNYAQALADGDTIYGVLSASATNHAGTGAGQFMPNLRVLADTATKAITESGVAAEDITYIECHGTGTELGDPIELKAMEAAITSLTSAKKYCALGTKANLGHMEAASGICSLIKVLLSMKHGIVAPCANLTQVNSVYATGALTLG
jgi:polyketide synthase PksN